MRILICGDRNYTNIDRVRYFMSPLDPWVTIIEGEARGADTLARIVALELGLKVMRFPADWEKYGRAAGPIRNSQMLHVGLPQWVVAFHNNIYESKGTANMLRQSLKIGLPCTLVSDTDIMDNFTFDNQKRLL